jgi:hypothetical protein
MGAARGAPAGIYRRGAPPLPAAERVPCRATSPLAAHRPVRAAGTARPEKQPIGPCLGRQCGTAPDTARHERYIGPLSAGLFRASAGLGPGGPFGNL